MLLKTVLVSTMVIQLAGCTTEAQRKAAENVAIQKQAAQEAKRICALPAEQREAELKKLKDESGVIIHCGH